MNAPWRGVRFGIGGFDQPPNGLRLTPHGALEPVTGRDAVRQALLLLLLTRPGERVMRPSYGCELHRILFWPNDDTTAGLAVHYVRRAIERWEPRVDRVRIEASRSSEQPGRLIVSLAYRVRATGSDDELALEVELDGADR